MAVDARLLMKRFDWTLFGAAILLALIGIAFIWSATHWSIARAALAPTQFRWLVIGLAAFAVAAALDYRQFKTLSYPIYAAVLLALVWVLLFGEVRQNSRRWITLFGYNIQPSELAKVGVVLALARYLTYRRKLDKLVGLIPPFLMTLVPMALILKEPDLGTALVFLPTLFAMLYVAGAPVKRLAAVAAAGAASAPALWFFVMSARQKGRILGFLSPLDYAAAEGWHVRQSLAAVVAGGVTGEGFSSGSPVLLNRGFAAHTDFIFSVIAHEWGLIGAAAVLVLLLVFFSRSAEIARTARDPFARLLVVGFLAMLAFQALVNRGMTVRLCPITGLTLPFVSYGGSSLLTCFIMAGFVVNVGMRRSRFRSG